MLIWIILAAVPSIVEAWLDRHGEGRSDKIRDTIALVVVALVLSILFQFLLNVLWLKSIALLLAWRILLFDYLVSYLLIRNGVIVGHWFTYNGQTSWFDRLVSRVNPVVRLLIRVILFGVAVWFFVHCTI